MSKNYKKKHEQEEAINQEVGLSKKELYDLEKERKLKEKEKLEKKKKVVSKKKTTNKTYQTNLAARIFAIIMLILMVGSILASAVAYLG